MNLEYIGVDGAIIDDHFIVPDEMIDKYVSSIRRYFDHVTIPSAYHGYHYYNNLILNFGNYISAKIQGVYENGVVFEFVCHIDDAACKYDTATSAYLIVMDDGSKPVFIIDSIDARCNDKRLGYKREKYWLRTNKEYVDKYFSKLGERIDLDNFIGSRLKENIINRRRLQKKVELIQSKVRAKVCKSIDTIENFKVIKKKELK